VEFKSGKVTTATVISSDRTAKGGDTHYTVCFTINEFAEVPAGIRSGYEAAEHERESRLGPRCEVVHSEAARGLKRGDRLLVEYLLENNHHISIHAIRPVGVNLIEEKLLHSSPPNP
jgi:hypothetical protein